MRKHSDFIELTAALTEVGLTRHQVLKLLEGHLADSPEWPTIRSRILGMFGDKGLQGKFIRLGRSIMSEGESDAQSVKVSKS